MPQEIFHFELPFSGSSIPLYYQEIGPLKGPWRPFLVTLHGYRNMHLAVGKCDSLMATTGRWQWPGTTSIDLLRFTRTSRINIRKENNGSFSGEERQQAPRATERASLNQPQEVPKAPSAGPISFLVSLSARRNHCQNSQLLMPYWAVTGQGSSFLLWRCLGILSNKYIHQPEPACTARNESKKNRLIQQLSLRLPEVAFMRKGCPLYFIFYFYVQVFSSLVGRFQTLCLAKRC